MPGQASNLNRLLIFWTDKQVVLVHFSGSLRLLSFAMRSLCDSSAYSPYGLDVKCQLLLLCSHTCGCIL